MIGLSETGKRYAMNLTTVVIVIVGIYFLGRRDGRAAAKTAADEANAVRAHAAVVVAQASADSLDRVSRALLKLAAASRVTVQRDEAKTDTAHAAEDRARDFALAALHDSTASVPVLRVALDSLTRADSVLSVRFANERRSNQQALIDHLQALQTDSTTIEGFKTALTKAAEDHVAQAKVIADLKGQQPGIIHRAVHGVVIVAAAAGCGGLGALAGPAGAIGGAVVCAAVAGVIAP